MRDDLVAVVGQRVGAGHGVGLGLERFTVEAQLGDWAGRDDRALSPTGGDVWYR